MAWLTTDSFHSVDRLLAHPVREPAKILATLGPDARPLLRYQVSEQNRAAFQNWEMVQLIFGMGLFFFLLFGTREGKLSMLLVVVMIALTAAQRLFLTPEIIGLGRLLDFTPPLLELPERAHFWVLHNAYAGMEVAKWGIGVGLLASLLLTRRMRSDDARQYLDAVDKRYNRHVNR